MQKEAEKLAWNVGATLGQGLWRFDDNQLKDFFEAAYKAGQESMNKEPEYRPNLY